MERQNNLLPLIATFKLAKACLLFIVAFGLHTLWKGNAAAVTDNWVKDIRIDPENHFVHAIVSKMTGMPPNRLHQLGVGTVFYGLMFAVEGVGLLLKKRWAEYMTVITTTTFLPLEIYELIARPDRKMVKAIILLINLAVLGYLALILWRTKKTRETADALPASL